MRHDLLCETKYRCRFDVFFRAIRILGEFSPELMLDADKAGIKAMLRTIGVQTCLSPHLVLSVLQHTSLATSPAEGTVGISPSENLPVKTNVKRVCFGVSSG